MQTIDNPFVRFKNVQKSYDGETLVVKDLNLDIAAGEFVTMLGPSGSGKTTCLMMLAGFETATHGDIVIGGNDARAQTYFIIDKIEAAIISLGASLKDVLRLLAAQKPARPSSQTAASAPPAIIISAAPLLIISPASPIE